MDHPELVIVTLNWNGKDFVEDCITSLLSLHGCPHIIVLDNGSTDGSIDIIDKYRDKLDIIKKPYNLGFAGGVNVGIKRALELGAKYVALINNDAIVDKNWASELVSSMNRHADAAIVTSRLLTHDGRHIDSTGDFFTFWGLPYPRGREDKSEGKYLVEEEVFGGSGGASIYRAEALGTIGLFDEDFFAYFEDVDISFRAQLLGWHVYYCPTAIAYHLIGATSSQISGFGTYQTFKNLPQLYFKNLPSGLLWKHLFKFTITYFGLLFSAIKKTSGGPAVHGFIKAVYLMPKTFVKRWSIQHNRVASNSRLVSIIKADPPKNQAGIWRVKRFLKI